MQTNLKLTFIFFFISPQRGSFPFVSAQQFLGLFSSEKKQIEKLLCLS